MTKKVYFSMLTLIVSVSLVGFAYSHTHSVQSTASETAINENLEALATAEETPTIPCSENKSETCKFNAIDANGNPCTVTLTGAYKSTLY